MRIFILVALIVLMADGCLGGGGGATTTSTKPPRSGKLANNSTSKPPPPHGPKNTSVIITRLTRPTTAKAGAGAAKTTLRAATTAAGHHHGDNNSHGGHINNQGRSTHPSNATHKPTSRTTSHQRISNTTVAHVDSNHSHENSPTHNQNNTGNSGHGGHPSYAAGGETDMSSEESQEQGGSHGSGGSSSSSSHGENGHGSSEHGGGDGDHHVAPPSYQLSPHTYSYKPEGFSIYTTSAGLKSAIVGFYYTTVDQYDRYLMRVRYHGHPEFATLKLKINKTDSNELYMKNFLDASYIVCVTLFSSSGLPEYPPLSTSDMCIDVTIGEEHPIGEHHGSTGLLSPLLLAVAFVLLVVIIVGTRIKKAYLKRARRKKLKKEKKEKEKAAEANRRPTLTNTAERRKSIIDVVFRGGESRLEKSPTEMYLDDALKQTVAPEWLAATNKVELVNSNSANEPLSGGQNNNRRAAAAGRVYENRAYDKYYDDDDDYEGEYEYYDEEQDRYYQFSSSDVEEDEERNHRVPSQGGRGGRQDRDDARALSSVQTLRHVLDNKPWAVRQQQQQQQISESIAKF